MGEISLGENFAGRNADELIKELAAGVQVTMVRKARAEYRSVADVMLSTGRRLAGCRRQRGRDRGSGRTARDSWSPAASSRIAPTSTTSGFSSARPMWSACRCRSLPLPAGFPVHLLHVRRYDADIVPTPDLMLEFGDRVGVLMPPDRKEEIRRYFGDTVKAAAEFSYVSLGHRHGARRACSASSQFRFPASAWSRSASAAAR